MDSGSWTFRQRCLPSSNIKYAVSSCPLSLIVPPSMRLKNPPGGQPGAADTAPSGKQLSTSHFASSVVSLRVIFPPAYSGEPKSNQPQIGPYHQFSSNLALGRTPATLHQNPKFGASQKFT